MQSVLAAAPGSSQASDAKSFLAMTALEPGGMDLISAKSDVDQILKAKPDYVPALIAQAATRREAGSMQLAMEVPLPMPALGVGVY
jgi:hypothetical protein